MKKIRTITASIAAAAMTLSLAAPAAAQPAVYSDPLGVHANDINAAYSACLLWGHTDGTYRPNDNVTEAQVQRTVARLGRYEYRGTGTMQPASRVYVANALYHLLGFTADTDRTSFSDVPLDYQGLESINAAVDAGIMDGYADGTFGPEGRLTRGQFAKIVMGVYAHNGYEPFFC
jgi:hypothetical protein